MAEDYLRHTTRDALLNNDADGAGVSDARFSDQRQAATASVGLPLRQAFRQPQGEPTMHDITEKFRRACDALEVGQLVKDEYFTLFESIGALEIMDPKMDSGFLLPGESLEDEYDTLAPLLPEEVIGIMDQLLCYEMAWHTGYPLSQTLFTSVYTDKLLWPEPRTVEEAQFYRGRLEEGKRPDELLEVLRAYCLAVLKCCDFVIAKITGRDYFEEEDFCTHTYNRVLFVQVPGDVFQRELDAAAQRMEDTDLNISPVLRKAITDRLTFRLSLLRAFDLDCPLDNLSSYWPPIYSLLPSINATQQLGRTVPGSFSTKIQRRLASTVPPRPIVELSFPDAFQKLTQLVTDCEEATRFTSLETDPLEFQSFLWAYASRSPTPLTYSRSYLATLLFHPQILNAAASLPLTDVRTIVMPCSTLLDPTNWAYSPPQNALLPKPPRLQIALLIDEFIERAGQPYLDFWTALGQNTCRLRRLMTHVITGWDQLQADAASIDSDLAMVVKRMGIQDEVMDAPLTTWTYAKKLWMVEKCILLGFEQDIYLPDEYATMYHFLSLISSRRKTLLTTINAHFTHRYSQLSKSHHSEAIEVETAAKYITSLIDTATGIHHLAKSLSSFYTTLAYLNLLPRPLRPFSSQALRYELRMKPFLSLHPPEVPPFADTMAHVQPYGPYNSDSDSDFSIDKVSELLGNVERDAKFGREAFMRVVSSGAANAKAEGVKDSWEKEGKGLIKCCVAVGVAVGGLRGGTGKAKGEGVNVRVEIPEMGTRYADGWVVGRVVVV